MHQTCNRNVCGSYGILSSAHLSTRPVYTRHQKNLASIENKAFSQHLVVFKNQMRSQTSNSRINHFILHRPSLHLPRFAISHHLNVSARNQLANKRKKKEKGKSRNHQHYLLSLPPPKTKPSRPPYYWNRKPLNRSRSFLPVWRACVASG